MAKKKKRKQHTATDLPIILDYEGEPMSVYDPIAMMPYSEPSLTERTRFKKLKREQKAAFKSLAVSAITHYWETEKQIPFGESMADIRHWLTEAFAEDYGILLKEDTELKKLPDDPCHFIHQQITQGRKTDTRKEKSVTFHIGVLRIFLFSPATRYLFCKRYCSSGSDWMRCNSSATICRTSARMRL